MRLEKYTGTRPSRACQIMRVCQTLSGKHDVNINAQLGLHCPPGGHFGTLLKLSWLLQGLGSIRNTFYSFQDSNEGIANT